jgi:hypothetical protein
MSAVVDASSQPTSWPGEAQGQGDPHVQIALDLGWEMGDLYGLGPPASAGTDPGGSALAPVASRQQHVVGLVRVEAGIRAIRQHPACPSDLPLPTTSLARRILEERRPEPSSAGSRAEAYRRELVQLHERLVQALGGASRQWGSAYQLGVELATATRLGEGGSSTVAGLAGRVDHLRRCLEDLSSSLPPHAGQAVAQSLGWWHEALSGWFTGSARQAKVEAGGPGVAGGPDGAGGPGVAGGPDGAGEDRGGAPGSSWPLPYSLGALTAALPEQRQRWRALLTGRVSAEDLLDLESRLSMAREVSAAHRRLGWAVVAGAWLPLLLLACLTGLVLALLAWVVPGDPAGLAAIGVAFLAGTTAGAWHLLSQRTRTAVAPVEESLWKAALDRAVAVAASAPLLEARRASRPLASPPVLQARKSSRPAARVAAGRLTRGHLSPETTGPAGPPSRLAGPRGPSLRAARLARRRRRPLPVTEQHGEGEEGEGPAPATAGEPTPSEASSPAPGSAAVTGPGGGASAGGSPSPGPAGGAPAGTVSGRSPAASPPGGVPRAPAAPAPGVQRAPSAPTPPSTAPPPPTPPSAAPRASSPPPVPPSPSPPAPAPSRPLVPEPQPTKAAGQAERAEWDEQAGTPRPSPGPPPGSLAGDEPSPCEPDSSPTHPLSPLGPGQHAPPLVRIPAPPDGGMLISGTPHSGDTSHGGPGLPRDTAELDASAAGRQEPAARGATGPSAPGAGEHGEGDEDAPTQQLPWVEG